MKLVAAPQRNARRRQRLTCHVRHPSARGPRPAPAPFDVAGTSLFFDLDGTLIEIAEEPDAVVVPDSLAAAIDRLAEAMPGRVAIVSGRSLAQLDRILGRFAHLFAVAGSHGAEQRLPGVAQEPVPPPLASPPPPRPCAMPPNAMASSSSRRRWAPLSITVAPPRWRRWRIASRKTWPRATTSCSSAAR
ncbi:trehalose-phosphatase [Sphingomonas sp. MMS24-JH45]